MVAGSTGLAPLRAIIMDLCHFADNPRVHLFFGARYPCELYDLRTLWEIAATNPWLSVSPVSEYPGDPPWAADYPDVQPPRGLHVRQTGRLPEVVTKYGGWGDRQILICRRTSDGARHAGGVDRQGGATGARPARPARGLSTATTSSVTFVPFTQSAVRRASHVPVAVRG